MSARVLGSATRTARKEHACYWCRDRIVAGERFFEWRQAEDGRLDTFRLHDECDRAHRRAAEYTNPMWEEQNCCNVDYDGGSHARGQNCPDCSDMPVNSDGGS